MIYYTLTFPACMQCILLTRNTKQKQEHITVQCTLLLR